MRRSTPVRVIVFLILSVTAWPTAFLASALPPPAIAATTRPFVDGQFKGRIAYSADGNHNDPDDWIASPVALAIFAEAGLRDRLVHFDYNSILPLTNPEWEKIHAESVLGGARHYGFNAAIFFDCRQNLEGAIASIVQAINTSSADNPLYFIIAGPMEVPYRAMQQCDRTKLRHVYCISHSNWNDGYAMQYKFSFTKRSVIEQDVHWVQIRDQNRLLSFGRFGTPAKPAEFGPYFWMRDSTDPKIKFLWERMLVSTRPDPSDSGMAWFLATGDEECTPEKLKALLAERRPVSRVATRPSVRLEAENFRHLEAAVVEKSNDRNASHRLSVVADRGMPARIRTRFDEPFARAEGRYDVEIRYRDPKGAGRFALFVNGSARGAPWTSSGEGSGWRSHVVRGVDIKFGDEIRVDLVNGSGGLDFVQLNAPGASPTPPQPAAPARPSARTAAPATGVNAAAGLDDPQAMPGGLIVAGKNPGYLKYNGGKAVFLVGPDNPEEFLYLGTLQPDGTRTGGGQSEMIARMARAGVNAFHCLVFRMKRCNFKNEGDDTHAPFVDHDPAKPLNRALLDQWDGWMGEMEKAGINLHLELYNDATDIERMGWKLDAAGNLHPDEQRFVAGIVERFKHRKNILWGIQESSNKLPRERIAHFKKIGELIAKTDHHHHPIVQSFVVPNDPEGDSFAGMPMTDDYAGDPHIRVVTWLHVVPNGADYEKQHKEYLKYAQMDRRRFVTMKNETYRHPRQGEQSRRYMWSCALTGLHTLEAYHHAGGPRPTHADTLRDDGLIRQFMEQTEFYRMHSQDELAHGSTKWVLAQPGESYIAYTYDYSAGMGLKNLPGGTYDLLWFDTETGASVTQKAVAVKGGNTTWSRPAGIGNEIALDVKRAAARDAVAGR